MKQQKFRRGLSLVEVLVTATILVVAVLTATAMFSTASSLRDYSGAYSHAGTILQRKLEQVRRLPYSQLTYTGLLNAGVIDPGDSPYSFTTVDSLTSELSNADGRIVLSNGGRETARADVILTWDGLRGNRRRVTATTFVSSRELWVKP